jgi:hypothetical protein
MGWTYYVFSAGHAYWTGPMQLFRVSKKNADKKSLTALKFIADSSASLILEGGKAWTKI